MVSERNLDDVWVGRFASRAAFEEYLALDYEVENESASTFALDQGIEYLDEEQLESSFHRATKKCKTLLKDHSFWESYLDPAERAFHQLGDQSFNSVVLVFGGEVRDAKICHSGRLHTELLGKVYM